jgi:hypothetical protein
MDPLAGSGFKINEDGVLVADDCDEPAAPAFGTTAVTAPAQTR